MLTRTNANQNASAFLEAIKHKQYADRRSLFWLHRALERLGIEVARIRRELAASKGTGPRTQDMVFKATPHKAQSWHAQAGGDIEFTSGIDVEFEDVELTEPESSAPEGGA